MSPSDKPVNDQKMDDESIEVPDENDEEHKTSGQKIDEHMDNLRVSIIEQNRESALKILRETKSLLEHAGDWERRNRLKVYEGVYHLICRNWDEAVNLLVDTVATFTATELISFEQLVLFAVTTTLVVYKNRLEDIKVKILENSEIASVLNEQGTSIGVIGDLVNHYYNCKYDAAMRSLIPTLNLMKNDPFLKVHWLYFSRRFRANCYKQYITPYQSIPLAHMSGSFGLSVQFIVKDLLTLISAKLIHDIRVDAVGQTVEKCSDARHGCEVVYNDILQKSDFILNRMQKLIRIVEA